MIPVLWVTQVYPRHETDILGSFLHRLARELPARGIPVRVLAPGAEGVPGEESRDDVRVLRFRYAAPHRQDLAYTGEMQRAARRHPLRFAAFLRRFRSAVAHEIARGQPALVHAHWWVPAGVAAAGPAGRAKTPLVLSLHGTDIRLLGRFPWARPVARRVFRDAALVLPVSRALGRESDRFRLGGPRREILPMPADPGVFRPADPAVPDRGPASFVVAARLTAQKRVDVAIRALARCGETGQGLRLQVAGDGPERGGLEALAKKLGVGDRVVFHGMLPARRLADLFRSARAVILPSVAEGYGLTIVEGALCGIPGVGARSGGIEELIEPGVTGLLVEPEDPGDLARALLELGADSGRAIRLGRAARERALAATPGPLADRLAALYRELVPRASGMSPPGSGALDAPRGGL